MTEQHKVYHCVPCDLYYDYLHNLEKHVATVHAETGVDKSN